jgi:hypothetical protein
LAKQVVPDPWEFSYLAELLYSKVLFVFPPGLQITAVETYTATYSIDVIFFFQYFRSLNNYQALLKTVFP